MSIKMIPSGATLVFLDGAGIGEGSGGSNLPEIRNFDVFYSNPPVVGFHVVGDTQCSS